MLSVNFEQWSIMWKVCVDFFPWGIEIFNISYQGNAEFKFCVQEAHSKEEGWDYGSGKPNHLTQFNNPVKSGKKYQS